jgi:hypothetical protein
MRNGEIVGGRILEFFVSPRVQPTQAKQSLRKYPAQISPDRNQADYQKEGQDEQDLQDAGKGRARWMKTSCRFEAHPVNPVDPVYLDDLEF